MARIDVPYFKWRGTSSGKGRPRWEPGPALRAKGFKGRDLKDDAGEWLDYGRALQAAMTCNEQVAEWKRTGEIRRPPAGTKLARSGRQLWEMYIASPRFQKLAVRTRADYASKAKLWLDEFGDIAVPALRKSDLHSWWEMLYRDHGHAMANGTLAVARAMLSYAEIKDWRTDNPARALGIATLPARCMVWSPSELEALITAADSLGLPGIGDAVVIALHTGQRQADVLALAEPQTAGGLSVFKQAKTGARVRVPHTDQLAARLAALQIRRSAGPVVAIGPAAGPLIRNAKGGTYDGSSFGKDWRRVRARAAETLSACAGKLFLDLRDTAITRLALAGCTVAEIRAITGHSLETVHQVLKHYLALDDRMAVAAIAKLKSWMQEEGIAL